MKNLKISLTAIIFTIILTISTVIYAYTGVGDVDPDYKITMPGNLSNGVGSVSGISSDMSYQFVEITATQYAKIKKLEASYELIQASLELSENRADQTITNKYEAIFNKYNETYGEGSATEVLNYYGDQRPLELCRSEWIVSLADYNESNWQSSTNNKITLDLTTFEGTKYFVGWIKTTINSTTVYDAEAYIAKGTKTNNNKPDDNKPDDNKPDDNKPDDNKPDDNKPDDNKPDDNNQNNNKSDNNKNEQPNNSKPNNSNTNITPSKKQDTTASSEGKSLPKTGASSMILGLIAMAGSSAGISYIKYKKIK